MAIYLIYFHYLTISLAITWYVGNDLHKNGRPWIIHLLRDTALSDRINDLLLLGYRLLNGGYILITMMSAHIAGFSFCDIVEFLSIKLAIILCILAWLHYQNIGLLILFSKLKSKFKWEL